MITMEAADPLREKVKAIFAELVGKRADNLCTLISPTPIQSRIASALVGHESNEESILATDEITFHLTDWNEEAAFLVALQLFPERFSDEEIQEGIDGFLVHAPHHIIAAARLAGHSTEDIFKAPNS